MLFSVPIIGRLSLFPAKSISSNLSNINSSGIIVYIQQFVYYHTRFFFNVCSSEERVLYHIGNYVEGSAKVLRQTSAVKAGIFLSRKRVQVSAVCFDIFGNFPRASFLRSFENHVLNEVRDSVIGLIFITRSYIKPESKGKRFYVRYIFRNYPDTAGKFCNFIVIQGYKSTKFFDIRV